MTRTSTLNTGEGTPVPANATGIFTVRAQTLTIETEDRVELIDITDRVIEAVRRSVVREGVVSLWSMHTTCAVFINEAQQALHADIKRLLETMVDRHADWMHNDPQHSDCDRVNADSHLRAMLLGHSLTLQVTGGQPVLGQWQRLLVAELDGPRSRTLRIQIMGIA